MKKERGKGVGIPRRLRLKYSTLGHIYYFANEKGRKCDLPPGEKEKRATVLCSCHATGVLWKKGVCFAVSLNGADSGANRSEQLSKGTFLKQSPKVREQSIG